MNVSPGQAPSPNFHRVWRRRCPLIQPAQFQHILPCVLHDSLTLPTTAGEMSSRTLSTRQRWSQRRA